jgi:acyl-CoA thioesterase
VVAESTEAVYVEIAGSVPALLFPRADLKVDLGAPESETGDMSGLGLTQLFSLSGCSHDPGHGSWAADGSRPEVDGANAAWVLTDPPAEHRDLRDAVGFDPARVLVEVLDPLGSDDPRAISTKRVPVWGDVGLLVDVMSVRQIGDLRFEGRGVPDDRRPVVEGSQMLGQSIIAAGQLSAGRRAVSAHMAFIRAADSRHPLTFDLDRLADGRTFSSYAVRVSQGDRVCAAGTVLLDATAPDLIRHAAPAPSCAGPYESPSYDMSVLGRDIRVVDGAYTDDPSAPVGPPVIDTWVRFADLADAAPTMHAALLVQFMGHMPIAAALRPHAGVGQAGAHLSISTAINAISVSLHSDVRADEWMLYHHDATFAGDGMTHTECRVYDEPGRMLASFGVDAMVRAIDASGQKLGGRHAL